MKDQFIQNEWEELCERVIQTAIHVDTESDEGTSLMQAKEFCDQEPPDRYTQLLDRFRAAAELAVTWQTNEDDESQVDTGQMADPYGDPGTNPSGTDTGDIDVS